MLTPELPAGCAVASPPRTYLLDGVTAVNEFRLQQATVLCEGPLAGGTFRIAGLEAPIDTVFILIREHEASRASCQRVRQMGFQGKLCIHPDQVGQANDVFTPSEADLAQARKLVAAFAEAEAAGSASIQVEGYFVDYPIVEKARRLVALAEAIEGNRG